MRPSTKILLAFIISWLGFTQLSHCQELSTSIKANKNKIEVGDKVIVTVTVNHPVGYKVTLPTLPPSPIELTDSATIDTQQTKQGITYHHTLIVSGYDSGRLIFPPLPYTFSNGRVNKVILSDTFSLYVSTIPVDTSKPIKVIKPPFEIPYQFDDFLPHLMWLIVILAVLYSLWRYYQYYKKKKLKDAPPPIILVSPIEEALSKFTTIKQGNYIADGKTKEYYSDISDVLRGYISRVYAIDALEFTTNQTLRALDRKLTVEEKNALKDILELSDLVKFAKYSTLQSEDEQILTNGIDWVKKVHSRLSTNEIKK
jgi:hypothetical protein